MASSVDNIVIAGPYGSIEYAVRKNGTKPARKDLNKLKKKDKQKYLGFMALFEQYVNNGLSLGDFLDDYKHDKISGILKFKRYKSYPYRIPCFKETDASGRLDNYVLTHVFKKREKDGHQIKLEVEKADAIRTEHQERQKKKK